MKRRKIIFASFGLIITILVGEKNKRLVGQSIEQLPRDSTQVIAANTAQKVDPAQYLRLLSAPKFKLGHTLPPLTRWGWILPVEARIELADRWGYALEWGGYASIESVTKALSDPKSGESVVMRLAMSNPNRYKLAVILSNDLPNTPKTIWLHDNRGELVEGKKNWSPEAPLAALQAAAKLRVEPLRQILEKAPIAMVLNGGEYGLSVPDAVQYLCERDPKVLSAKGNRDWSDYISERKAYQESFVAKAVRQTVPNRIMYIYYPTDSSPIRRRFDGWQKRGYGYKYMQSISDYPSSSTYFKEINTGWTGDTDILTGVLNSVGQQIQQFGHHLSYNWVCSGWIREKKPVFGEINRYIGFLKCYYAAGMIGGVAGYFDYPEKGFGVSFNVDSPPNWLKQIIALARVHALFSHLEHYLRQGNLLPGPIKHRWSKDAPAYEFPTNDPDVRVLVRKQHKKSSWLVVAWAASGNSRKVTVKIPQLGSVSVIARPIGSTYTAKKVAKKTKLVWVDQKE